MEVSCSEALSQFEMLSGLEKFSLDSGDAENDENQEKMGLLKRPKIPNVFSTSVLSF